MTATRRRFFQLVEGLLLAGVVGASLLVAAGANAAEPTEADIRIRVIHAKTGEKKIDPKVTDLVDLLKPYAYNNYRQVIDEKLHLGVSDTRGLGLLSGKTLNVTLAAVTKEKATIRLLLLGQTGQMLDVTVAAAPHKLFFIAGPRYDDGVLFIGIEPHYDPEAGVKVPDVGKLDPKEAEKKDRVTPRLKPH